ncbi:MAG TPA: AAA family ATPase, partial [Acidimicrobiales bacterium]|nr:AAA family ATPase [Acidimicrobiales bacterium]
MTTVYERNAPRLRELLRYLVDVGHPTSKQELLRHVERLFPPEGEDLALVSDGSPRWENDLLWETTNLVKAGWVTKDGKGTWQATDSAPGALQSIQDPMAFQAESVRKYNLWNQARKAQKRRAWLVRGSSVRGESVISDWLREGWMSIAASQLRPIEPGISADELAVAAREDYDHLKHQELKSKVDEIVAFTTKMAIGDVVITTSEGQVFVGDVVGDWMWQISEGARTNIRRYVEWRNTDTPIDFSDLPAPLPAKLSSGANVVDLTSELDLVDDLTSSTQPGGLGVPGAIVPHQHLPEPTSDLADDLLVDLSWLKHVRDLLDERHQVVFYGPPGTGKTWIARKLSADLVGPEQVKLVQFHPAYSYEDFFEGFRPAPGAGDGTIAFELRPGPLRQLVSRAVEHRDQAFVLIIDEINRANL